MEKQIRLIDFLTEIIEARHQKEMIYYTDKRK